MKGYLNVFLIYSFNFMFYESRNLGQDGKGMSFDSKAS